MARRAEIDIEQIVRETIESAGVAAETHIEELGEGMRLLAFDDPDGIGAPADIVWPNSDMSFDQEGLTQLRTILFAVLTGEVEEHVDRRGAEVLDPRPQRKQRGVPRNAHRNSSQTEGKDDRANVRQLHPDVDRPANLAATIDHTTQPNRYRQTTQQRTLGGLTLMGVRLYSPQLGRFLQVDPYPAAARQSRPGGNEVGGRKAK